MLEWSQYAKQKNALFTSILFPHADVPQLQLGGVVTDTIVSAVVWYQTPKMHLWQDFRKTRNINSFDKEMRIHVICYIYKCQQWLNVVLGNSCLQAITNYSVCHQRCASNVVQNIISSIKFISRVSWNLKRHGILQFVPKFVLNSNVEVTHTTGPFWVKSTGDRLNTYGSNTDTDFMSWPHKNIVIFFKRIKE